MSLSKDNHTEVCTEICSEVKRRAHQYGVMITDFETDSRKLINYSPYDKNGLYCKLGGCWTRSDGVGDRLEHHLKILAGANTHCFPELPRSAFR